MPDSFYLKAQSRMKDRNRIKCAIGNLMGANHRSEELDKVILVLNDTVLPYYEALFWEARREADEAL